MKKLIIILLLAIPVLSTAQIGLPGVIYVSSPTCTDTDANDFITAAGITNATEKSAICNLVTQLKDSLLWTKYYFIYPLVGGTSTSCKFNLIDPDDDDASFRLTFNGGWTFGANGAVGNGTTGYADTHLQPATTMTKYDTHLSAFIRNNSDNNGFDITGGTASLANYMELAALTFGALYSRHYSSASGVSGATNSNSIGLWTSTVTASNSQVVYKNGVSFATNATPSGGNVPAANLFIAALNTNGTPSNYSNHEYIIISAGQGLTAGEAATMYNIFNAFKTTLGR